MNIVLGFDPTVSLLENIQLFLIIIRAHNIRYGCPKKIVFASLYLMTILHIVFVSLYARAYNLELAIRPFLDIFIQPSKQRASAMIDVAQIIIAMAIADYMLSMVRRRKGRQATNVTPASSQELYQ